MNTPSNLGLCALFLAAALPAQLAGAYTINPTLPTGGNNFASLADATAALTAQGVAGPVTFLLYDDAGPYTESASFVSTSGPFPPQTAVLGLSSWTGTSSTNRVTFQPAPGESPVFDASGRAMGVFWGGADYVTIQGIEIKNAIFDAVSLYSEASHGVPNDPIIDGCVLHDCGGTGVTIYGNSSFPVNTLVQNCVMYRLQQTNAGSFNTLGRFGYVTTRRSTNTRIVHNTFLADTGAGTAFCVLGAYPSSATEVPYAEFSNNLVVKTAASAAPIVRIYGFNATSILTPTVCDSNCFFDPSGGPFALWGASGTTVAATLLDWQTNALRDLASLQGDPSLRDAANHDVHLTAASNCRAASTVVAGVAADLDGQTRGTPADIGADAFSAGTWTAVGTGCAGTGNLTPTLATSWPFLGSVSYTLTVRQTPPQAIVGLFGSLGLAVPPIPFGGGCTIELDPLSLTSLAAFFTGPVGTGSLVFTLPANPAFAGFRVAYQALVLDAGAPIGLTFTNALDVTFDF